MASEESLQQARAEARAVLALQNEDLAKMFFDQTMRRNLTRTVRHFDRLVLRGGDDRALGEQALQRLGFAAEDVHPN